MPHPYPTLTPDLRNCLLPFLFLSTGRVWGLGRPAWNSPDDQRIQTGEAFPGSDLWHCNIHVSPGGERRHAVPSGLSPTELPLRSSHCTREGHTTHSRTSTRAAPRPWQLSMYKELRWAPEPETDVSPFLMGPQSSGETANAQTDK